MSTQDPCPVSLFILIDALGWEYIAERGFLKDVLPYRTPLRTVLGFSSGAIPSILTGLSPAQNGHWNLFYYDPQGSPFRWLRHLRFLPKPVLDGRIASKLIQQLGRRVLGMGPLFDCAVPPSLLPWFNWVEKKNIYGCGGIAGSRSIFDRLATAGVPHRVYSYHRWTDAAMLRQAESDLRDTDARFFFLYLCEMDGFLHMHCRDNGKLSQKLSWYEDGLRRLFHAARQRDPEATLAVFSDHGMTPISNGWDLVSRIEALGFRMPGDYLAVYDSTMARFWFFKERAKQSVLEVLAASEAGGVLSDSELDNLGIFFPDRRYGEIIFLLRPGWILSRSDFNGKGWAPIGMHGYHPDDRFSDAIFLSSKAPSGPVRTISDVYRCMEAAI